MKKNYISPTVVIVKIKASHLLSGSPAIQSGEAGQGTFGNGANFGRSNDFESED